MNNYFVHYGCGLDAPSEWRNYDASPTLRIQKIPLLGNLFKSKLNVVFPENIMYGDIVKGINLPENSCAGIYCSHVLEHLTLNEFRIALKNTYKLLKTDGIFRCIVPDLEILSRNYLNELETNSKALASITYLNDTHLGISNELGGLKGFAMKNFGHSGRHLWMWDHYSLKKELEDAGFIKLRTCAFNDCEEAMFSKVENKNRFIGSVAIECRK